MGLSARSADILALIMYQTGCEEWAAAGIRMLQIDHTSVDTKDMAKLREHFADRLRVVPFVGAITYFGAVKRWIDFIDKIMDIRGINESG